jgi:sugar O-acyltransferase (sialic acid O-acetyltransferase NeuD family)
VELLEVYKTFQNFSILVLLVNAIGSLPDSDLRVEAHLKFKKLGYEFMTLVAPRAIVSNFARLSEGVQVMPGAIVNANAIVGEGTIVNSGALVEHDCVIGSHNHLAPGCKLSGNVVTGNFVHIGTGAVVIQGIKIGANALVGAGATATRDLLHNEKLLVAKPYLIQKKILD